MVHERIQDNPRESLQPCSEDFHSLEAWQVCPPPLDITKAEAWQGQAGEHIMWVLSKPLPRSPGKHG